MSSAIGNTGSSSASGSTKPAELLNGFLLGSVIGKGGFGVVYKALNVKDGTTVAVKKVPLHKRQDTNNAALESEIELLKNLKHPNILKYLGATVIDGNLYIYLEFMENGSLQNLCKLYGRIPESLVAVYTEQVLQGLVYLHEQGVVHRDIKGANLLTTKKGLVKLADFGVASKLADIEMGSVVGTPYWMAPEVIEMTGATAASDIWSLGCTVIELCTGSPPYSDLKPMAALFRITQDEHPPFPEGSSAVLKDFLLQCFQKDPNLRVTAKKLLKHQYIAQIHLEDGGGTDRQSVAPDTLRQRQQRSRPAVAVVVEDPQQTIKTHTEKLNRAFGSQRRKNNESTLNDSIFDTSRDGLKVSSSNLSSSGSSSATSRRASLANVNVDIGNLIQKYQSSPTSQESSHERPSKKRSAPLIPKALVAESAADDDDWDNDFEGDINLKLAKARTSGPSMSSMPVIPAASVAAKPLALKKQAEPESDHWDADFVSGTIDIAKSSKFFPSLGRSTPQPASARPIAQNAVTSIATPAKKPAVPSTTTLDLSKLAQYTDSGDFTDDIEFTDETMAKLTLGASAQNSFAFTLNASTQSNSGPNFSAVNTLTSTTLKSIPTSGNNTVKRTSDGTSNNVSSSVKQAAPFSPPSLRGVAGTFATKPELTSLPPSSKPTGLLSPQHSLSSAKLTQFQDKDEDGFLDDDQGTLVLSQRRLTQQRSLRAAADESDSGDDDDPFAEIEGEFERFDENAMVEQEAVARALMHLSEMFDKVVKCCSPEASNDPTKSLTDILAVCGSLTQLVYDMPEYRKDLVTRHGLTVFLQMFQHAKDVQVLLALVRLTNAFLHGNSSVQENLCLLGFLSQMQVLCLAAQSNKDLQSELLIMLRYFFCSSQRTLQMCMASGCLQYLVQLVSHFIDKQLSNHSEQKDVLTLATDCLFPIFSADGGTSSRHDLKTDLCIIIADSGISPLLMQGFYNLACHTGSDNRSLLERISSLLFILSSTNIHVRLRLAQPSCLQPLLDALALPSSDHFPQLLKTLKQLTSNPEVLLEMEKSGKVASTLAMILRTHPNHDVQNNALVSLFNYTLISRQRQREVAQANVIPTLLTFLDKGNSPLWGFVLPMLCNLAVAGKDVRQLLLQAHVERRFVNLLTDPSWQVIVMEALSVWLVEDREQLEPLFLQSTAIDQLEKALFHARSLPFQQLLQPLLRMLDASPALGRALAESPKRALLQTIFARLGSHVKEANARVNMLKVVNCLVRDGATKIAAELPLLKDISAKDGSVLVRGMANQLIAGSMATLV